MRQAKSLRGAPSGTTAISVVVPPPFFFAADRAVDGLLVDGPIDDLNVMSRRGAWSHSVERISGGESREINVEQGVLVLVARHGDWQVDGTALAAGDSVILPAPATVALHAESGGELFAIRLQPA